LSLTLDKKQRYILGRLGQPEVITKGFWMCLVLVMVPLISSHVIVQVILPLMAKNTQLDS